MKKILLGTSLLFIQHFAIANCTVAWTDKVIYQMSIKNSTPHQLNISECGNPNNLNPIALNETRVLEWYRCSQDPTITQQTCKLTDAYTGKYTTLTMTFSTSSGSGCNYITASDETPEDSPLNPYACSFTYHPDPKEHQTSNCPGATRIVTNTAYFEVFLNHKFLIQWNNIIMNLAKGQVMANKLASLLIQHNSSLTTSTASYDGQKLTLNLNDVAPNPYEDFSTVEECQAVNSAT